MDVTEAEIDSAVREAFMDVSPQKLIYVLLTNRIREMEMK